MTQPTLETPEATSVPGFLTLDPRLAKVLKALVTAGLEDEARFLIDVTLGALADVDLAGPVLHWLGSVTVFEQLALWSEEEPLLEPMARLSGHLASAPELITDLPKPIGAFRVAASFRGRLDWYLAALLAARRPVVAASDAVWAERVRCWIFAQAVRQAMTGNFNDRFLKDVSRAARNAFDDRQYRDRLQWILGLRSDAVSLHALSFDIAERAKHEVGRHKALASAIRAVASGERSPLLLSLGARWGAHLPTTAIGRPGTVLSVFSGDEGDRLAAAGPVLSRPEPRNKSPREASSFARSLLLARGEELNFLPFSWWNLPAGQIDALGKTIDALLRHSEERYQLLGAFAVLGSITGTSMTTVGEMAITAILGDFWSLHPDGARVFRTPSRKEGRWSAPEDVETWLSPLAGRWQIDLLPAVAAILGRVLRRCPTAAKVKDLWYSSEHETLEASFNAACRELGFDAGGRLTSGRLTGVLTMRTYMSTQDAVLARLVISHPRCALPGACAYPTWTSESVQDALARALPLPFFERIDTGGAGENAAGSELDVRDSELTATLGELRERYRALLAQPEKWCERHNVLTSYCVIALLAATGARPVDSPFESPRHFNWKRRWVFVDDKAQDEGDDTAATGRVLPLAEAAMKLIETTYLPHLAELAVALSATHPALAREVEKLARRESSDALPFCFFLNHRDGLDWYAVRESSLKTVTGIRWPLPWNLFRHRLATRLRRCGLDPEVIDAVLGHAELGAETYGDHSWRVPEEDFRAAVPHLNAIYAALELEALPIIAIDPAPLSRLKPTGDLRARPFGIALRRLRREEDQLQARRQAQREIEEVLAGRELSLLSAEEVDALGQRMMLADTDVPHRHGAVRHRVLEKMVEASWEQGKPVHRTRRQVTVPVGALSHRPEAVEAIDQLATVKELYAKLRPFAFKAPTAALFAAIDVCLMSRVSDTRMLESVRGRKDHRLVKLDGTYWLEYQTGLSDHPQQPVARIPLTSAAARHVSTSLSLGNWGCRPLEAIPKSLEDLAGAVGLQPGAAPQRLLSALARVVAAANSMELPRVLAAWLDGRIASWGLLRADWIRFRAQSARQPCGKQEESAFEELAGDLDGRVVSPRTARNSKAEFEQRIAASSKLIGEMNLALREWADGMAPKRSSGMAASRQGEAPVAQGEPPRVPPTREATKQRLERLVKDVPPEAPASIVALVEWAIELMSGTLVASSIQRYLAALSPRFRDFLHSEDLAELDADDLTEIYGDMVEARYDEEGRKEDVVSATAGPLAASKSSAKDTINGAYVGARLRQFHSFARRRFGLDDPDWGEIASEGPGAAGSPGMLREAEYLQALRSLVGPVETADRVRLCHGMLLLLTFRFGLRGKEAHGLQRRDWADCYGSTVVLVRSNALRRMKTPAGQRQVPQLGRLLPFERALIRRVLATWAALTDDPSKPLLCIDAIGNVLLLRQMRRAVIASLRAVTRNPLTNMHHARHTFASELGWALISPKRVVAGSQVDRWIDRDHARELLLGSRRTTRRALWALARAMGHASPITTLRSYFHLLPDLHAAYVHLPAALPGTPETLAQVDDLDAWEADSHYLAAPPELEVVGSAVVRPSAEQIVIAMKLLAGGKQAGTIAEAIGLGLADPVTNIEEGLERVTTQLTRPRRFPRSSPVTKKKARKPRESRQIAEKGLNVRPELLPHIESGRWEALKLLAARVDSAMSPPHLDWEAGVRLIRPSAHIVMWDPSHFQWVGAFLDAMRLRDDVLVFQTDNLDPHTAAWADSAGFHRRLAQRDGGGRRILQIDGVRDRTPEVSIRHRCAIVPKSDSVVKTRYELVALWFAFCLYCRCSTS